jgi:hypothetical protein
MNHSGALAQDDGCVWPPLDCRAPQDLCQLAIIYSGNGLGDLPALSSWSMVCLKCVRGLPCSELQPISSSASASSLSDIVRLHGVATDHEHDRNCRSRRLGCTDLMGFFKSVPREIEEAAIVDGCTVQPAILTVIIFAFTLTMQEFVYALTFISSSEEKPRHLGGRDRPHSRRHLLLGRTDGRGADRECPGGNRVQSFPRPLHQRHHGRRRQITEAMMFRARHLWSAALLCSSLTRWFPPDKKSHTSEPSQPSLRRTGSL